MAYDGFLSIDGVHGESTDPDHANWIEIISLCHELSRPEEGGPGVRVADFAVTKVIDSSTPALHKLCCTGQYIPIVMVELCEVGGSKHVYMRWTLQDVVVSSVRLSGQASDDVYARPLEEVSFRFGVVRWEYVPVTHAGKPGAALEAGWNTAEGKPT